jgi:hypothetical protein
MTFIDFVNYVYSYYGEGGLYDFGVTREEIAGATGIRLIKHADTEFAGDSLDRELVRDIMLAARGEPIPEF